MKAVLFNKDGAILGQTLINEDITNIPNGIICYDEEKYIGREVIGFDFENNVLVFTKGFKPNEELLRERVFELENLVGELLIEQMGE